MKTGTSRPKMTSSVLLHTFSASAADLKLTSVRPTNGYSSLQIVQSFKNDLIEMSDHSLTLTDHGVRKVLGTGTYMYNLYFTLKGFRHTIKG